MMQIAIVFYSGMTALDAIEPYEVLRMIPESEIRFVSREPGSVRFAATKEQKSLSS